MSKGDTISAMFTKRIGQIHEALAQSDFYWQIGYYALVLAAVTHAGFIGLFLWLDIPWMAWVNVGSVLMYLYAIFGLGLYTLRTKDDRLIGWLVYGELLGHNLLATYFLSRDAGFQYYIYTLVILPFFITTYGRIVYIVRVAGAIAVAMWIELSSLFSVPRVFLNIHYLTWLHHINLLVFLVILGILAYMYAFYESTHRHELIEENIKDPMTGLFNRRYMQSFAKNLPRQTYGICVIDIDRFKRINDRYGHLCGDKVIETIAERLKALLGEEDIAARWGGEEFVVVLPRANEEDFARTVHYIHQALQHRPVTYEGCSIDVTVTVGGTLWNVNEPFESALARADEALYAGKTAGRNQVRIKAET